MLQLTVSFALQIRKIKSFCFLETHWFLDTIEEFLGVSPAYLYDLLPFIIDVGQVVAIVSYQYNPQDDHAAHCQNDILSNRVLEQNSNL